MKRILDVWIWTGCLRIKWGRLDKLPPKKHFCKISLREKKSGGGVPLCNDPTFNLGVAAKIAVPNKESSGQH